MKSPQDVDCGVRVSSRSGFGAITDEVAAERDNVAKGLHTVCVVVLDDDLQTVFDLFDERDAVQGVEVEVFDEAGVVIRRAPRKDDACQKGDSHDGVADDLSQIGTHVFLLRC